MSDTTVFSPMRPKVIQNPRNPEIASQEIDKSFVWEEGTRPDIAHDTFDFQLPIIDLSPVFNLDRLLKDIDGEKRPINSSSHGSSTEEEIEACKSAKEGVQKAIRAACEDFGFFQIVNHGFSKELVEQLTEFCTQIFDLTLEEKMKVSEGIPLGSKQGSSGSGYASMKRSNAFTRNNKSYIWNEGFNIHLPELAHPGGRLEQITNILWPGEPGKPESSKKSLLFRSCAEEYAKQSNSLTFRLLDLIAASLGLPEGSVESLVGPREGNKAAARIRVNHYPVCAHPQLTWGLQGHTDPSLLTLLHQDSVGGLQICFNDGSWHGVRPIPGALVVNVGDYLQAWTNRRFLSAEHRSVANEKSRRFSIAYFAFNQKETFLSPRPELIDAEHPPRYRPFTQQEYFAQLLALGVSRTRDQFMDVAFGAAGPHGQQLTV